MAESKFRCHQSSFYISPKHNDFCTHT
jgi:hypothetical protein